MILFLSFTADETRFNEKSKQAHYKGRLEYSRDIYVSTIFLRELERGDIRPKLKRFHDYRPNLISTQIWSVVVIVVW